MLSPRGFQELNRKVGRNEESKWTGHQSSAQVKKGLLNTNPFVEIHILQTTNDVLRERNDLETNFKNLTIKMSKLEKEEEERQEMVIVYLFAQFFFYNII